ncbi:hypothetical protein GOARA_012_01040 [Gordonia araii NBRC 100433]|uniref:Transmembrane protein n=1 Tax=Gordonia araii NBRC 100433 TaxID=1073574 RepID=G7GY78_9ACTN|nr:hypothetical protein [Gordonia araii]NNG98161.1 hypothetical protein [Gordonia araii NBRC 100433]GAB08553.1 hypothetical protein GOARA_012_01040 [Gordonia araii NBRC 100433]
MSNTDTAVLDIVPADDDETTASDRPPVDPAESPGVPVGTLIVWILGCAVLVVAAVCLPRLSEWADRYGSIPVFLGFFLVMSLAGRWFWAGTDAIIAAIRGKA